MRPGLCLLLLLGAAADDRVVLRRGDAAPVSVPPLEPGTRRALRREDAAVPPRRGRADPAGVPAPPQDVAAPPRRGRADPAGVPAPPQVVAVPPRRGRADPAGVPAPPQDVAVPPRRGRADPAGVPAPPQDVAVPPRRGRADPAGVPAPPSDPGRARRDLQASDDDDACQYVSVSGTTGQTSREGTYERVGECAARPYYECLDCSASDPQFLWYTGSQWFIGPGGCGATVAGIYINDAAGDLAALTGNWAEAPFTEENPAIAVECFAPTEAPTPLQVSDDDDACQYVSVSGTTGQTSREGTYERVGECAARPYYECLDCSASDPQFLWYTGSQWFIGPGGCGATVAGIYINDAAGDLAALTGSWAESPFTEENPAIAVECFAPTDAPTRLARTGRWLEGAPCNYVSVSGSTGWTSYHGQYAANATCDSKPSYDCLDCSGSGRKIWHHPYGYWMIGTDGCGGTSAVINIMSNADLEDVTGDWNEAGVGDNSAIAVTCAVTLPPTMAPVPCDIARVSGATVQTSYHGFYEATGTCAGSSQPYFSCLDCGSTKYIWYHSAGYWFMGSDADDCASTSRGIQIVSGEDLPDVSGDWSEWTGSEWSVNPEISVECYAAAGCQHVPGTTAKYRCFDCGGASALASVGDGHCDAENNVDPCYDGGDCCETTCVDGSSACGNYDCADPDAPPWPDPYYADAAWYLEAIHAPEAWAAGYTGAGVQILINDDGVDNTHPDLAKLDVANSCGVYAPCAGSDGLFDTHGTNCAAIAAADSNSACGVGVAPGAGIASCVKSFSSCPSHASEDHLRHNYNVKGISSNSWGSNRCEEYATSATDCPFECPSVSSADCPCAACDGDDWASGQLSATCEQAVVTYCTNRNYFNDDVTPCLELDHYFVQCGYWQLASSLHDSLVDGATNGRGGLGTVYVFAAGNSYDVGQDVNYAGYQNSRFTITVGAVHADMTHSDYSSSGAPVFISAPGGDGGNMAVAKPVGNGVTDNCADAGQGTSFAAPLVSGVAALMLEANPTLTWRDVQGVLAATARTDFNDEDDETGQWTTNQAGVKHSYKYGFGLVDALAAVTAATTWTTLPAEITLVTATTSGAALLDFDGAEHWVESEAAEFGSSDFVIEGVSVYVTIEHPRRGDLRIELERNGVTSLLTDDKLELGSGYTNWKFTTLRHWGERADQGAFTLRVADRRAGSGDDDDLGSRRRLDADDGVLVKWTLQLYGHDSDTSTPWTPQPTPRGGCDSVAVSGSTSNSDRHGTYLPSGRCTERIYYKCSDCTWTTYLWYHDAGYWIFGSDPDDPDEDGGCDSLSAAIYISSDEDLVDVSGSWTEAGVGVNSNIVVQCNFDPTPRPLPSPSTLPTAALPSRTDHSYSYSYSYSYPPDEWITYTLFEGATPSASGADLDVVLEQTFWEGEYRLSIWFTMPTDLGSIGDWNGLLGHDDGGHPYPYFNRNGLWFERQNGPHPQAAGLELSCFEGGASYAASVYHYLEGGGDCFDMSIEKIGAGPPCPPVSWCYDYDYDNVPLYAGCGYGKEDEVFPGSVTKVVFLFKRGSSPAPDDDDDCAPGWETYECRDDRTLMHGNGCASCEDCEAFDLTAASGGRVTCEPGTSPIVYYFDEDTGEVAECQHVDCSDDDDDDDEDCTPGWRSMNCLDERVMYGEGCTSCGDCAMYDYTAATDGLLTCKLHGPDGSYSYSYSYSYGQGRTATYYYHGFEFPAEECWYDDCGDGTDYEGPCTENCVACDGPGYEDCLECEPGYVHDDEDGDGGGSCCTPGYEVIECRDDGTPMRGVGCASCDATACALHDATFDFGGRMTCEPGTSPIVYYHDYDDDGVVDEEGTREPCSYDDCGGGAADEDEDHCTPGWHSVKCLDDGTVMRGEGCASCGDCAMYDYTAATGGRATCELHGPDGSYSYSYSHSYSHSYGQGVTATYYYDGVEQAVEECWYDDCSENEDEDWRWANSCRQDYCTSMGDDCYASMDWGEPATCSSGYFPSPPNPPEHDPEYTCCPSATSYRSGSCGDHAWGADRDGHLKCGEGREPYPEGDAALHAMGDDAETCCRDDDCLEGWRVFDCLDDGTVMRGEGCASCGDCDLWDFTAASEGRVTCKRDGHGSYSYSYSYSYRTATYFYDEDLDGRVDEERVFESCSYQSCADGDGDEDEDGCTPGWHSVKCLDDGTVMRGEGCASCGDCAMYDYTAATDGLITCKLHGPDGSYAYSYSYQGDMATYVYDSATVGSRQLVLPFNPHGAELRFRAQDVNDGMSPDGWRLYDGDNVVSWLTLGDSDQHTTHVCLNSVVSDNMDAGDCLELLGPDTHARLAPTDWVTVVFSASTDAPAVSISINGVVAATSSQTGSTYHAESGNSLDAPLQLYFTSGEWIHELQVDWASEECWHTGCGGECAVHGLGPEYAKARPDGTPCESGCECCRADGGCGECAGDHVCEFPHGADYGVCTSCEARFAGDDGLIERCRNEAGAGFDHDGTRYDNSCALGDDCTPGYWAMECRDDGHLWRADNCASCEDCTPVYDITAATGGQYTCDPTTNTYYYDEDFDGNVDHEGPIEACGYDDCSDDDDDGDDCTPGYEVFECHDGTPMRGVGCATCEDCALHDATFDFGGRMTCEPGTSPIVYYHDYDDDGVVDHEGTVYPCSYHDCGGGIEPSPAPTVSAAPTVTAIPTTADHWRTGPVGVCESDDDHWLGYMPSREACIEACDADGYDAMAWDMNMGDCVCFMQDQCYCVDDADDWCWCEEKDGFQPWTMSEEDCAAHGCYYEVEDGWSPCECEDHDSCMSAGGEPQCHSFGPMAFKGNFTVEMCIDCSNVTVADDLDWAPDGTTYHSDHSMGWCYSELDDDIGCTASPGGCWAMCEDAHGDGLVAIDWEDGECYCQNDCLCMAEAGQEETYLITREGTAVPEECPSFSYSYSYNIADFLAGFDDDTSPPSRAPAPAPSRAPAPAPTVTAAPTVLDCDRVAHLGPVMNDTSLRAAVAAWLTEPRGVAVCRYGDIATWDTSGVTDMSELFCASWCDHRHAQAALFNDDVGAWDTSAVTAMQNMFDGAAAFNRDVGAWRLDRVASTRSMFTGALAFDRPLDGWSVGAVTDMERMFAGAAAFNQPLNGWRVDKVTSTARMFAAATSFNQPLDRWRVENVTDMSWMFRGADAFDGELDGWAPTRVETTAGMFMKAASFNRPLGNWSLDALTKMPLMFRDAAAFDQDLGWCFDTHVRLNLAFDGTPCEATSCGVVQGPGGCAPSARPSAAPTAEPTLAPSLLPTPGPTTAAPTTAAPSPQPTLVPTPSPTTAVPTSHPTLVPTPSPTTAAPSPVPTMAPSPLPSPLPTPIQTVVQVASGVRLLGLNSGAFNANEMLRRAFALAILRTCPHLTDVTDIEAGAAGRRRATEWPPPGWTVRRLSPAKKVAVRALRGTAQAASSAGRRLDEDEGSGISYTGVARIDGTENASAVAAGVLDEATDYLTTAVSNGKFLETLVSAVANETAATTSGRRLDALDGVSVDVNATLEEVAEAEVAFFISTPVPTSVPSPVPTTPPSPAPSALPTTSVPTTPPSEVPSPVPTSKPSAMPTAVPIPAPSGQPTPRPTPKPTPAPTAIPGNPTGAPVFSPTPRPTPTPTPRPSDSPTPGPSPRPTPSPSTALPSPVPTTSMPSAVPTSYPTAVYVSGQLKVEGISLDVALEYKEVFVVALAAIAGVSEEKVTVLITAARRRLAVEIAAAMAVAADSRRGLAENVASGRRRLSGGVNIEYTISVDAASATAASEGLSEATPTDVDSAIESAAANFTVNGTNSSSAFSSIQTNSITAEVVVEGGPPPEPPNVTAAVPRSASKPRIIYQRRSRAVRKSNFGRPTPSTRRCRRDSVGSMAWRFTKVHAIFLSIT